MPVYSVEGKLGTGKSKFCVWRMQEAFRQGRRVASNLDLTLEKLVPERRVTYTRLPDKPKARDLEIMGHGNPDSYDEDRNGLLVLDELGTWLNARSFQDPERAPLIDWLIHARKHGWDVYLIVQDSGMIDKQVREALVEHQVRCMRWNKVRIPVIGGLLKAIYKPLGYLPNFHTAASRVGFGASQVVSDRWSFVGKDLHAAYDTRQIFKTDYPHGVFTALPSWDHWPKPSWRQRIVSGVVRWFKQNKRVVPHKPKLKLTRLLMELSESERILHAKRIERLGLWEQAK